MTNGIEGRSGGSSPCEKVRTDGAEMVERMYHSGLGKKSSAVSGSSNTLGCKGHVSDLFLLIYENKRTKG